jgi:DNA helicase II / ATP-dependent DNA helicase PcrA
MIEHKNLHKILGPPGTGKTHRLIDICKDHLQELRPNEIAFLAFTRKAATEARDRAMETFKLKKEDLPYFSTLHSLAFQFHGIEKRNVMVFNDYVNISKMLGLTISSQTPNEDGSLSILHTKGDRLFFLENLARTNKISLRNTWSQFPNDDIMYEELQLLAKTVLEYKSVRSKVDFTDMIMLFNMTAKSPAIKVFILDEAQDLSPLQWDMAKIIAEKAEEVYIAGDDDQAIYAWAGADVRQFQDTVGTAKTEVLDYSYRLPKRVHEFAEKLIRKVKVRAEKPYRHNGDVGGVVRYDTVDRVNMREGTWLLLSRNIFLLNIFTQHCLERGYMFESKYANPVDPEAPIAIKYWEELRKGGSVTAAMAKIVYKFLSTKQRIKFGAKKRLEAVDNDEILNLQNLIDNFGLSNTEVWSVALDRLKPYELNFFRTALRQGDSILNIRIKINTIHGVKGGEADNVVLLTDMSRRTFEEMNSSEIARDNELRVWYVGVTRAKKQVYIIDPTTPWFMDI